MASKIARGLAVLLFANLGFGQSLVPTLSPSLDWIAPPGFVWNVTGQCTGTNGGVLTINSSLQIVCEDDDGGSGTAFSAITGGTNTTAAMVVGSGASLRSAAGILGIPNSTSLPGTCTVGDVYHDNDAAVGSRYNLCTATNTWTAIDNPFGSAIDAGELSSAFLDATTDLAAGLCGTNEILEDQGASWACIATPTGGTAAWQALTNTADTATSYTSNNTAETVTFSFESAFGASQQFLVRQQTGNPTAGTLLDVRAADAQVTVFRAGDGTNGITVSQAGALTAEGTGTIIATDLSCTNCIGTTELDDSGAYAFSSASNTFLGATFTGPTADPADSGVFRASNAENGLCWEAAPAGTDVCLQADASEIIQISGGTLDGGDLTTGTVTTTQIAVDTIVAADVDETTAFAFSSTTNTFVGASYTDGSGAAAGSGVLRAANNVAVLGVEVSPAGADCTLTLDASEVFQLANCTLDGGDIAANSIGTGPLNFNYVASHATGLGLTGGAAASEGAALTTSIDYSQTLAGNPAPNAEECIFSTDGAGGGGFLCEGTTANTNEQLYLFPAVDGADTTNFIAVSATSVTTIDGVGLTISSGSLGVGVGLGLLANANDVSIDYSQTLAGNPALNAKECLFVTTGTSGGGFLCEGSTGGNTNEQLYLFPALDGADTTRFIATDSTEVQEIDGASLTITSGTLDCDTSSTTVTGCVELATAAETDTGTDATRAVTPDGLAGSTVFGRKVAEIIVFNATTALTTGDGKVYFAVPAEWNGMNLVAVSANVVTVSSSGLPNVDLARCAVAATGNACSGTVADMLSTNVTLDANENKSSTAATAAVIDTANDDLATDQIIRIDVDGIGTGTQGLTVTISAQLP